jgi:hypothetical protein
MKKIPKNPESDAALKAVVKMWSKAPIRMVSWGPDEPVLTIELSSRTRCVLDLRKYIARRAPLTGIKKAQKQMSAVLRSKGGRGKK